MWQDQKEEIVEFCDRLRKDFPKLFGATPTSICLGWHSLIYSLSNDLYKIIEKLPDGERYRVAQIKEKFGGLRYYMDCETPEMTRLIQKAEGRSYKICEWCGDPGYQETHNWWIKTLCKACHEKRKSQR